MPKFRKKPIVIEAVQFTKFNFDEVKQFAGTGILGMDSDGFYDFSKMFTKEKLLCISISTLEGDMLCTPGDWIIKGVKGEFYPCKPDIFEELYDKE